MNLSNKLNKDELDISKKIQQTETSNSILASFDIGIKNMAICVFECGETEISIREWKVLNLTNTNTNKENNTESTEFKCSCCEEPKKTKKSKKSSEIQAPLLTCNKPAKFKVFHREETKYFCNKHAKKQTEYLLPMAIIKPTALKKMDANNLQELCKTYGIAESVQKNTKGAYVDALTAHFHTKTLIPLLEKKVKSNDIDLVTIGRNMTDALNEISLLKHVTHVIIENQISPIANRMKTIQGMLTQYFIMNVPSTICKIEYVSSANKLKSFVSNIPVEPESKVSNVSNVSNVSKDMDKSIYKQNKRNGIDYATEILNSKPGYSEWKSCLDLSNKKDDLADAFLQGIWYIQSKM